MSHCQQHWSETKLKELMSVESFMQYKSGINEENYV